MTEVTVILVHWRDATRSRQALSSLAEQKLLPRQVVVVENGSTLPLEGMAFPSWQLDVVHNEQNRGYTVALNQALARAEGTFIFLLNSDVRLASGYLAETVSFLRENPGFGAVTGKLYLSGDKRLDSTGIFWRRNWRPYDRGQGEVDRGQYDTPGEVFAVCGAAALLRREMLTDVVVDGEVWDSDLLMYYDDIDLCWRGQLLGWHFGYTPATTAVHDRAGAELLHRRFRSPADQRLQTLAVANRYLLWAKLADASALLPNMPFILPGDLLRWAYLTTRPALGLAVWQRLRRLWPVMRRKRRLVFARRNVSAVQLRHWWR